MNPTLGTGARALSHPLRSGPSLPVLLRGTVPAKRRGSEARSQVSDASYPSPTEGGHDRN